MKQELLFNKVQESPPSDITEDYFVFQARVGGDSSQYPSGFHLMRMSDHAIRYLLPPWGDIEPGYIYNIPFVRENSVFIANNSEDDGGFWYSPDLGDNWTKIQIGGTNATPYSVKASKDEKHQIYIDRVLGVYISNDYGSSWDQVGSGTPWDCGISDDGKYMGYADADSGGYFSDDYGGSFSQITSGTSARIDISYISHGCFAGEGTDKVFEYHIDTDDLTLIDDSLTNNYGFLSTSYDGKIFLTGDRDKINPKTLLYKDGEVYFPDLSSILEGAPRYGSQVSYDGRIMKQGDNNETAISFDYGETWEQFDPNNFNTF